MILSFKEQFNEPILNGTKIHTIREDKHRRWHEGRKIHFANHIRTPNYNQFYSDICTGIQKIFITYPIKRVIVEKQFGRESYLSKIKPEIISKNDGFENIGDFWQWFDEPFSGRLIHWTDFRY